MEDARFRPKRLVSAQRHVAYSVLSDKAACGLATQVDGGMGACQHPLQGYMVPPVGGEIGESDQIFDHQLWCKTLTAGTPRPLAWQMTLD